MLRFKMDLSKIFSFVCYFSHKLALTKKKTLPESGFSNTSFLSETTITIVDPPYGNRIYYYGIVSIDQSIIIFGGYTNAGVNNYIYKFDGSKWIKIGDLKRNRH